MGANEPFVTLVAHIRRRLPQIQAIYLFGSFASGEQTATSDIDLAVLGASPLGSLQRLELAEELAEIAGRDVDLIDLRQASTVLRSQVVAKGRALYRQGTAEVEQFEDFVYADYARLNEERAAILGDIKARGRVHGR